MSTITDTEIREGAEYLSALFDELTDAGYRVGLRYDRSRTYVMQLAVTRRGDAQSATAWVKCLRGESGMAYSVQPGDVEVPLDEPAALTAAIERIVGRAR